MTDGQELPPKPPVRDRNPVEEALDHLERAEEWLRTMPDPGTLATAQVHATMAQAWVNLGLWTQQQAVLNAATPPCSHPADQRELVPVVESGRVRRKIMCRQCEQELQQ